MWSGIKIELKDVAKHIDIDSIAINVNEGKYGPEISYYGRCDYDDEHGICIGFRDKKFIGIVAQDWTL